MTEITVNEILLFLAIFLACLVFISGITIYILKLLKRKNNLLKKNLKEQFSINNRDFNQNFIDKIPANIDSLLRAKNQKITETVTQFIFNELSNSKVFIHYTREEKTAQSILESGFKYSESIYKTTQEVINNQIDLTYKLQLYRPYGNFLVVISIPKYIFDFAEKNTRSYKQAVLIDYVLSNHNPANDLEFTLPQTFICGYINMENQLIVQNINYLKEFNWENYKPLIIDILK